MNKALRLLVLIQLFPLTAWAEFREYKVAGDSMSPVLRSGDRVTVETEPKEPLRRGELVEVAFRGPSGPMVKRLAAVPGDNVAFRDNAVWVNEERVREIDPGRWRSTITQMERFGGKVPEGQCLILGDNPLNSKDSGKLGLISIGHLKGRIVRVTRERSGE